MSKTLIARTYIGGRDLYHGIPDLNEAVIKEVNRDIIDHDYVINLKMELSDGSEFILSIRQEE